VRVKELALVRRRGELEEEVGMEDRVRFFTCWLVYTPSA